VIVLFLHELNFTAKFLKQKLQFYLFNSCFNVWTVMYVYSCNALSTRFFAVDRALNSYFMIMIMSLY